MIHPLVSLSRPIFTALSAAAPQSGTFRKPIDQSEKDRSFSATLEREKEIGWFCKVGEKSKGVKRNLEVMSR